MPNIWTEKYRPQTFDEFAGQPVIIKRIKAMIEQQNMPHLIFCGPAGVGKTTLALLIAKTMFGEQWRQNFLETNASSDRGIDVIRNQIKEFARTKAVGTDLPKILLLDESDALTREAQQALRRTMESYTKTARFILSANFFAKLIDPLKSRCVVFKFKPLDFDHIDTIMDKISAKEGFTIDDKAKQLIYEVSRGDLRRVENMLQTASTITKSIEVSHIQEIASKAEPEAVKEVLELAAISKNFSDARKKLLRVMMSEGLSGLDVVPAFQKQIWGLDGVDDQKKLKMIQSCAEAEFRIVEGADEYVQLEALLANFAQSDA